MKIRIKPTSDGEVELIIRRTNDIIRVKEKINRIPISNIEKGFEIDVEVLVGTVTEIIFERLKKDNPGKCSKMDCVNKVVCSADYPNELCYEKFIES